MAPTSEPVGEGAEKSAVRQRIVDAAFAVFMEAGYAGASTLAIATRARVSKRELYALVGNKREMLAACIGAQAKRLQLPANRPAPRDREGLARALTGFGSQLLREVTDPTVVSVFQLAISEAVRAPEVARAVDSIGRETARAALREVMAQAASANLLSGRPGELADQFSALLWGSLMLDLLLCVAERPGSREISRRARDATAAFLGLHPQPGDAGPGAFRPA